MKFYRLKDYWPGCTTKHNLDCVYVRLDRYDVRDLLQRLLDVIMAGEEEYTLTFPGTLEECGMWDTDLPKEGEQ